MPWWWPSSRSFAASGRTGPSWVVFLEVCSTLFQLPCVHMVSRRTCFPLEMAVYYLKVSNETLNCHLNKGIQEIRGKKEKTLDALSSPCAVENSTRR